MMRNHQEGAAMHREYIGKTTAMTGVSDLTVLAPIKPGLIPALDAVTYKNRVKRVLRALHLGRQVAHEYDLARVMSDAVERVGRIHSVRIAILEPQDSVLLAVTFDGPWEAYVRVIWQKVARLLDLIFCNTVDYVCGWDSTYEEWGAWLRFRQVETPFLYAQPGVTAEDVQFYRMYERFDRREPASDLRLTQAVVPTAEEIADRQMIKGTDPGNLGTSKVLSEEAEAKPVTFRQGVRSLAGLYRLADVYPPGTSEGEWLLRAAHELLPEFRRLLRPDQFEPGLAQALPRFQEQIEWFESGFAPQPAHRTLRMPPPVPTLQQPQTIQGGILTPHDDVSVGVLLLLSFTSRAAIASFLGTFTPTTQTAPAPADTIASNIGITIEGLRLAGLDDAQVAQLPEEFVAGMERRAGWLGDVRVNHPRRWRLPALNWNLGVNATDLHEDDPAPRIDMSSVHVAVQLRLRVPARGPAQPEQQGRARLLRELNAMVAKTPGTIPLSLQWMHRLHTVNGATVEHFGFGDGGSDPVFDAAHAGTKYSNHVHVGEALVGYENSADPPPPAPAPGSVAELLFNGSFLAVRKLRQDLGVLDAILARAQHGTGQGAAALDPQTLMAKMMGRWPIGHPQENWPLADENAPSVNDFLYEGDAGGSKCPLQAHIRRANPRSAAPPGLHSLLEDGTRAPRIFRRSLSYGPQRDAQGSNQDAERGLVFMAYNASLAEQFEVVQRWLSGGNSTGGASSAPDPFLGIAEPGRTRVFRFAHGAGVERVHLDGDDDLHADPAPIVRLEWGCYFFAPSTEALKALSAWQSTEEQRSKARSTPWNADEGKALIEELQRIEQQDAVAGCQAWKAALEDPETASDFSAASIWAAIRTHHGGALDTAYGRLVAGEAQVQQALLDPALSVKGYVPRMKDSFDEIYLGYDARDPRYQYESEACNTAIENLPEAQTLTDAVTCTQDELGVLIGDAQRHARESELARRIAGLPPRDVVDWELTLELRELVDPLLATFCEKWFGLAPGDHFERGGFIWTAQPVRYPGHFMAPSRYFFQPHPGPQAERLAIDHGKALLTAMTNHLAAFPKLQAPVAQAVLGSAPAQKHPDFVARTLVGAIMGFVPTVNGSLRRILAEWLRDGTFWTLRAQHGTSGWNAALDEALMRGMQLRALPDTLWRTRQVDAEGKGTLKGEGKARGPADDVVVIGTLSAAHARLERGAPGMETIFGGDRKASPHPTHACPGMHVAIAMIKGFLQALLASPHRMRAGHAPLTLIFDGTVAVPTALHERTELLADKIEQLRERPQLSDEEMLRLAREIRDLGARKPAPLLRTVNVWCIGDSWLSKHDLPDIIEELHALGYARPAESEPFADLGRKLLSMADPAALADLDRALRAYAPPHPAAPHAILLGGGGNDIVQRRLLEPRSARLYKILKTNPANVAGALDQQELCKFLQQELEVYYRAILDTITRRTAVPVLIHGYDWPIPDGRPAVPVLFGPWLQDIFRLRQVRDDLPFRSAIMAELINQLNAMIQRVAASYQRRSHKVFHMGFPGFLQGQFGQGGDHTAYWHDELHPNRLGCKAIAAEIGRLLALQGVKP
jgi:deferrochelatase/peroxidase EfeB